MNIRTAFIVGLGFQILAIFGLFIHEATFLQSADVLRLRTVPVDPWSITRGQYVTLGYKIGEDFPVPQDYNVPYNETVYVVVKTDEDGFAERTRFTTEIPELADGEHCVRGRQQWSTIQFPDISQYFVEEGRGPELERSVGHELYVEVAVDGRCRARIKNVVVGPEDESYQDLVKDMQMLEPAPVDSAEDSQEQ